jgi:hypothetical protein
MNNAIEFYENISVTADQNADCCPVTKDVGKRGLYLALTGSAVIGIWGIVCLVAGLCSCDSIQVFKQSLLMALTGM